MYRDGKGNNVAVVYEGASADNLTHTICQGDGTKLQVHDSNLHLINQPDFENIPKTPLDYRNEVGQGLSLEEAQALARPRALSPAATRAYELASPPLSPTFPYHLQDVVNGNPSQTLPRMPEQATALRRLSIWNSAPAAVANKR